MGKGIPVVLYLSYIAHPSVFPYVAFESGAVSPRGITDHREHSSKCRKMWLV